jgi:hypothetical protein
MWSWSHYCGGDGDGNFSNFPSSSCIIWAVSRFFLFGESTSVVTVGGGGWYDSWSACLLSVLQNSFFVKVSLLVSQPENEQKLWLVSKHVASTKQNIFASESASSTDAVVHSVIIGDDGFSLFLFGTTLQETVCAAAADSDRFESTLAACRFFLQCSKCSRCSSEENCGTQFCNFRWNIVLQGITRSTAVARNVARPHTYVVCISCCLHVVDLWTFLEDSTPEELLVSRTPQLRW